MAEYKKNKRMLDLEQIFAAAVKRVDPYSMIKDRVHLDSGILSISSGAYPHNIDVSSFSRIVVLGAGKASAPMARAVEEILGSKIDESLVAVKYGHTDAARGPLRRIRLIESGHPVPDENSERAAAEMLSIAQRCDEKTLVIMLISGGGSALLSAPAPGITLEDKQNTTSLLLSCGADIQEINCVRKHLSAVKGGRLAEALYPARVVSIILSDVVGDKLDAIASGPCVSDTTTLAQARSVIEKYELTQKLPSRVKTMLFSSGAAETPKEGDPAFTNVMNVLLGTNFEAMKSARDKAVELGYRVCMLSSMITGEAREIAKMYAGIALDQARNTVFGPEPLLIIGGGETTVTMRGKGKGGRNQEMALAFLAEMKKNDPQLTTKILFLAASTDGNDGPTDAAGAFYSHDILTNALNSSVNIQQYLSDNDSYHFFQKTGGLLITGPTNTNVCDLQFITAAE